MYFLHVHPILSPKPFCNKQVSEKKLICQFLLHSGLFIFFGPKTGNPCNSSDLGSWCTLLLGSQEICRHMDPCFRWTGGEEVQRHQSVCSSPPCHMKGVTRKTQDNVMSVLAWSFQALAQARFPVARHDGEPWTADDGWRKQQAGSGLEPESFGGELAPWLDSNTELKFGPRSIASQCP